MTIFTLQDKITFGQYSVRDLPIAMLDDATMVWDDEPEPWEKHLR